MIEKIKKISTGRRRKDRRRLRLDKKRREKREYLNKFKTGDDWMNLRLFARTIAKKESGKKQVNITQISEQ